MIKFLEIRNFQKWKKIVLEFDRRITTIVGRSDVGKSTILRALRWLTLNQFLGPAKEIIRWDAGSAKVLIHLNQHTIERRKGSENTYTLDGRIFHAFGASKVPEPVSKILKITEANFQGQLDPHFWFSQSAGEVSRELNQIINLGTIDTTMANIASQSKRSKIELNLCEKRLDDALEQRQKLLWVGDAEKRLAQLEKQSLSNVSLDAAASRLTSIVAIAIDSRTTLKERGREAYRASGLVKLGQSIINRQEKIKKLARLTSGMRAAQKASRLEIREPPNPRIIEQLAAKHKRLKFLITKMERGRQHLCETRKTLESELKILKTETKGKCPVCGSVIRT